MNPHDYNTSIMIMPNGNIYNYKEGLLKRGDSPTDSSLLGRFIKGKDPKLHELNADNNRYTDVVTTNKLTSLAARVADGRVSGSLSAAADSPIANSENLSHLQLIRLYPEVQGTPTEYFHLESMFKVRQVPQLEYRETWMDTVSNAQYLDRLEEANEIQTPFDEIRYDLKKLVDTVYTPIEDMYRTMMNPQEIDLHMVRWSMKKERNKAALAALKQIGNSQSSIGAFQAFTSDSPYHSETNAANVLNDLFADFLKANDVPINTVAMNPDLYAKYTSNTWTLQGPNYMNFQRISAGGTGDLPGLPGVKVVVDVEVPDNTIYAVNREFALRLGEGPKLMRRYHDEIKQADAIKITDFHEFIAVNSQLTKLTRKYGMTIPVDAS